MAQRFVTETKTLIADQIEHISDLERCRHSTVEARTTLASLQELLELLRENLAKQRARAGMPQ